MAHKKIPPPKGGPVDPNHDPYEHRITALIGICLTRHQAARSRSERLPANSPEAYHASGYAQAYGEVYRLLKEAVRS